MLDVSPDRSPLEYIYIYGRGCRERVARGRPWGEDPADDVKRSFRSRNVAQILVYTFRCLGGRSGGGEPVGIFAPFEAGGFMLEVFFGIFRVI